MIVHIIDTIGSNTLKGAILQYSIDKSIPHEKVIKQEHRFYYRSVAPNLPPEDLVADVVWILKHGAEDVKLEKTS